MSQSSLGSIRLIASVSTDDGLSALDMPQATLLSYFSKPAVAIVLPPTTSGRDKQTGSDHLEAGEVPSNKRQGVVETAREQSAHVCAQLCDCMSKAERHKVRSTIAADQGRERELFKPETVVTLKAESAPAKTTSIDHLPEAVISPVSAHHLQAIRRLTATTLPVRYSDALFKTTVTDSIIQALSRVVLYESEPVGWIRCRLEPHPLDHSSITNQIYIQALALLSPYRNLGLATILLNEVLSSATTLLEDPVCIYAHVWEKNEDALDWYAKRGFERVLLVDQYYTKLRPSSAWVVRKELRDKRYHNKEVVRWNKDIPRPRSELPMSSSQQQNQ